MVSKELCCDRKACTSVSLARFEKKDLKKTRGDKKGKERGNRNETIEKVRETSGSNFQEVKSHLSPF